MSDNSFDNFPTPDSASTPFDNATPQASAGNEPASERQVGARQAAGSRQPERRPVPYPGQNGHGGANENQTTIDLSDPRTRAVVEQLMATLNQDGTGEETGRKRFSISNYIAILRRRWRPMLLIFAVVCAAVTYKMRPTEVTYVSTATMLLPPRGGGAASAAMADPLTALGLGRSSSGGPVETEIAILTSPTLVQRAKNQLPRPLRAQSGDAKVSAKAPVSMDLIDITVEARNKNVAMALANTIVDVYQARTRENASKQDDEKLKRLDKQVQAAYALRVAAKNDLQAYKEQTGVFDIGSKQSMIAARRQVAQQKVDQWTTEVAAGRASSTIQSDATETGLRQRATDAKARYEAILRDFYPSSPEALKAKLEYDDADRLWKERIATLLQLTRDRLASAQQELAQVNAEAAELPEIENKLSEKMATAAQLEATYQALANSRTSLLVTRKSDVDTATKLTPATSASENARTWTRALMLGIAGALALAILLAALLEHLDNTPHTADDLEPVLHASVLGTVPLLKGRAERRLAHVTDKQPAAAALLESCRILRSNLLFSSSEAPLRSVLITSADPGEGKSLCAFNLATVMALDGKRVVLLDCDLRRPSQHLLAEIPLEPGLSNVIEGEATIEEALRPTAVANLSLIAAGTLPHNPPELLGSPESRRLIQELKDRSDIVIIDSPPVLSLTDAQVLSSLADGVVMVVAADSTPLPHLQRSQAMLRHVGGRLLGVIFNKAKSYNNPDVWDGYYNYYTYNNETNGKPKSLTAPKTLIEK